MEVLHLNKEKFDSVVNQKEKVVLIDFYADWCGPCRMMGPVVDEIAKENDDIIVGKVNVDEEEEIASKYNVYSIPTLLIFKEGKLVRSFVGVTSKDALLKELK